MTNRSRRDLANIRRCANLSTPSKDRKKLIRELQLIDFSMIDTVLYLNAYPNSAEALDYYQKLRGERNKILDTLKDMGEPISSMDSSSATDWNWVDGPWPWEIDAN